MELKRAGRVGAALAAVATLIACSGGDSADSGSPMTSTGGGSAGGPRVAIASVKVFGDSLADSGTFGYKFTVQNAAAPAAGYPIWSERVAAAYGVGGVCPYFRATSATSFGTPSAACTSYAVGGARINNPAGNGGAASPYSIPYQMQTAAGVSRGYTAGDLVLVDGGGNDAADLTGAFLGAGADPSAFLALVQTLVPAATVSSMLSAAPGQTGLVQLGGAYMKALAIKFAADIDANVIGRGASYVAVLNMPGIADTPRFAAVLASISGRTSATHAANVRAAIDGWTQAFNAQLQASLGSHPQVAIVDFHRDFADEVANPARYGLSNVTATACPATGTGSDGLPTYTFATCTDSALAARGVAWTSYAFSDSFHPTPYGHQLLGQTVSLALARKGWL